ncbi:hypothetical protein [Lactobacillus intestinalis]|uniref:Type I restriction enzyme, methylase subunit n=1 Tax=Lactobacillus intestinalis DSM 6629 TaxID=1423761 RepID=A0ABR5PQN2_9LACO|nr:hypothetical protein [Lactobacillus intestinalis]KRM33631.1 type I restriction enzyme, methylase subunit [Lactobacillus intestinalis DSM 6629]UTW39993.1 restriction endonuclease subunit M [Lactobacillus intestinalis]
MKLEKLTTFVSGSPEFRIKESEDPSAPVYRIYDQNDFDSDFNQVEKSDNKSKTIKTEDQVVTTKKGDIIFSLLSGKATRVSSCHKNYLIPRNFIKLIPKSNLDSNYLVYVLNQSPYIRKQLFKNLQGTAIHLYRISELKQLDIGILPKIDKQILVGKIYFQAIHLKALKQKVADFEYQATLRTMEEILS